MDKKTMGTFDTNEYFFKSFKYTIKTSFDLATFFTAQSSAVTERLIRMIHSFPEMGKAFLTTYFEGSQNCLTTPRKQLENYRELDWATKLHAVKKLEKMGALNSDANKKAAELQKEIIRLKESQKGLAILRKYLESLHESDWTTQNAAEKGLEAIETSNDDAFNQAAELQEKMKLFIEKAKGQPPK